MAKRATSQLRFLVKASGSDPLPFMLSSSWQLVRTTTRQGIEGLVRRLEGNQREFEHCQVSKGWYVLEVPRAIEYAVSPTEVRGFSALRNGACQLSSGLRQFGQLDYNPPADSDGHRTTHFFEDDIHRILD